MKAHTCPSILSESEEFRQVLDRSGIWVACEYPERPVDNLMIDASNCPRCQIAATAARRYATRLGMGSSEEFMDFLQGESCDPQGQYNPGGSE